MSGNIITSMWRSLMATQQEGRDEKFQARIAENSIYSQRLVEKLHVKPDTIEKVPDESWNFPIAVAAHPDVKHSAAGLRSSLVAAEEYATNAQKRRDELLAKYQQ